MSQTKVQLIAPIGIVTASTVEITGVVTATTLVGDIAGTVTGKQAQQIILMLV